MGMNKPFPIRLFSAIICGMKANYKEIECKFCGKVFKPKTSKMKCCGQICRFWSHVNRPLGEDKCWEWTSNIIQRAGYGNFCDDNRRFITTHRFSYEITYGKIPEGMHILHKCDNRKCVNPDHLFAGTQKDNIKDMWEKGRQQNYKNNSKGDAHYARHSPEKLARGNRNANSKISENQVLEIRERAREESQVAIAKSMGISMAIVNCILRGKTWRHVK